MPTLLPRIETVQNTISPGSPSHQASVWDDDSLEEEEEEEDERPTSAVLSPEPLSEVRDFLVTCMLQV